MLEAFDVACSEVEVNSAASVGVGSGVGSTASVASVVVGAGEGAAVKAIVELASDLHYDSINPGTYRRRSYWQRPLR